jgi:hypothetical protein
MNLHMKTTLRAIIQYHNVPIPALKIYAMSKTSWQPSIGACTV